VLKVKTFDLDQVRQFQPDIVILQLGTNDLVNHLPHFVAHSLVQLSYLLHEHFGVKIIVISQVLYRCPMSSRL